MKNSLIAILSLLTLAVLDSCNPAFGQGALTPPGAPAPMMKTLDQIEPRKLINTANTPGDAANSFIISQPGSYYLGADIVGTSGRNGILVAADNVTINLNGFSLSGVAGAAAGITNNAPHRGVTILNGRVTDWPTAAIVIAGAGAAVSDVTVLNSGAAIVLDTTNGTLVTRCSAHDITVAGSLTTCISADTVEDCTLGNLSSAGSLTGIAAGLQVSRCALNTLTAGASLTGISAVTMVMDSSLVTLAGTTISGITGSRVSRCQVTAIGIGTTTSLIGISGGFVSDSYVSGLGQGGAGTSVSAAFSAFSAFNCSVLNATFNSTSVTPGIRASFEAINCSVVNVHNTGAGVAPGIALNFFANSSGLVSQCRADNCEQGILVLNNSQVLNCNVAGCDTIGIQAGQRCNVVDCNASGNGLATTNAGISVDIRTQVTRCNANDNTGDGIAILGGCRVENCTAENNGTGTGAGAFGSGIRVVSGAGSRIEANQLRDNHRYGVEATSADFIGRNTSGGNAIAAYLPSSGANFGPVQTPATASNPMANF